MLDGEGALTDARTILIVADDPEAASAGEHVARAYGHIRRANWADAARTIPDTPRLAAVIADAAGLGDERLSDLLAAIATASDARLVVLFESAQIDAVAGAMLPTDAVLLCEANAIEQAAGIALALVGDASRLRDSSRDARKFQQLNEEVARFAETLARLAATDEADPRDEEPNGDFVSDRRRGFGTAAVPISASAVRSAIRARRLREDAFDLPGLFEDPAWDMLLDLFAAELERRQVSVSSLCIAAAVAPTTALRWIGKLVEAGLFDRRPDDFDRRRAFVSLTPRASTAMRHYLTTLRRAGLTLG